MHTAALWAAITASVYTASTRPSTIAMNHIHNTMNHTHDTYFERMPPSVAPAFWMEKARARSDSVGYDWYFIGLGRIGATGIGMVATVD